MTGQNGGGGDAGTLDAVKRLEQSLAEHTDANQVAAARLAAARREADGILAAAHAAGTEQGRRRVAAILARATAEAEAIQAGGRAEAQELRERVLAEHDDLVAELAAIVTAEEA